MESTGQMNKIQLGIICIYSRMESTGQMNKVQVGIICIYSRMKSTGQMNKIEQVLYVYTVEWRVPGRLIRYK